MTAGGESGALRLLGLESDSVTSFLGTSLHTILCVTWQLKTKQWTRVLTHSLRLLVLKSQVASHADRLRGSGI